MIGKHTAECRYTAEVTGIREHNGVQVAGSLQCNANIQVSGLYLCGITCAGCIRVSQLNSTHCPSDDKVKGLRCVPAATLHMSGLSARSVSGVRAVRRSAVCLESGRVGVGACGLNQALARACMPLHSQCSALAAPVRASAVRTSIVYSQRAARLLPCADVLLVTGTHPVPRIAPLTLHAGLVFSRCNFCQRELYVRPLCRCGRWCEACVCASVRIQRARFECHLSQKAGRTWASSSLPFGLALPGYGHARLSPYLHDYL